VKKVGDVTQDDLEGVVEDLAQEHWGDAVPVVCGEFEGLLYEYGEGPNAWRRWFLRSGPILLFVTYNSTREARLRERSAVQQVLKTARREGMP
jgi:hypothetical protein